MIKNNIFQTHYLKEESAESLYETGSKNLKWECLGAACPSSCCENFAFSRISIHEIVPLSKYFPIVFYSVDPGDGEREISLCILVKMVKENENNYCTFLQKDVGCTLKDERPLSCKQYPFSVIKDQSGNYKILIRLSCPGFTEESAHQVIMPDNSISPYLEQECIKPAITRCDAWEETRRFVETLNCYNLIVPGQYNHNGESLSFNLIDAKKLYGLPKEVLNKFRTKGYMELINEHMNSLVGNCAKLIDVYLERIAKLF